MPHATNQNSAPALRKSPSRSEHLYSKTATVSPFFTRYNDDFVQKDALLEPKQFKNNLIMFEDKPQLEFAA